MENLGKFCKDAPSSAQFQKLQSQADFVINRPPSPAVVPLALMHEVFGKFMQDLQRHEPTYEDNRFLSELRRKMVEVYKDENERNEEFNKVCNEHSGALVSTNRR